MDKAYLESNMSLQIKSGLIQLEEKLNKLTTVTFPHLLVDKISNSLNGVDEKVLYELFEEIFITEVNKELEALKKYYEINEIGFYENIFHTANLICSSSEEEVQPRNQRIYLDYLIKKIENHDISIENILTQSFRSKIDSKVQSDDIEHLEDEEYLSINEILLKFGQAVVRKFNLSINEIEILKNNLNHYFGIYKTDFFKDIHDNFLVVNKKNSIENIEQIIDNRNLRDGKTSAIFKIEKSITSDATKQMRNLIDKNVKTNKEIALKELKECLISMIELVYKEIDNRFQDGKGLLEIIVDTSINERLGKALDEETLKLRDNLLGKDQDLIANEFYKEKRYKKHSEYQLDHELISEIFQDVTDEIRAMYRIPENDPTAIRLKWIILNKSTVTNEIFDKAVNSICMQNNKDLSHIIFEMRRLSAEASMENTEEQEKENTGIKK